MGFAPVQLDRTITSGGAEVATLTFADGDLNLFGADMLNAVSEAVSALTDKPPRATLIRAQGRTVSAGVDVQMFDNLSPDNAQTMWTEFFDQIIHPLDTLPCPTVFAAHALTLTAAFEIALTCDIILATPQARFGLVERVVGLTPSMGGTQRLADRAGSGRASELVMTGDLYDADTLHQWGVINAVHSDIDDASNTLTTKLADGPTRAHVATKAIIAAWRSGGTEHADSITPIVSGALFETSDLKHAVAQFLSEGPRATTPFTGS